MHFLCLLLYACVLVCIQLFAPLWAVAHQAPRSLGFSRQEYWSGFPFPTPRDLPDPGIIAASPSLAGGFFTLSRLGSLLVYVCAC